MIAVFISPWAFGQLLRIPKTEEFSNRRIKMWQRIQCVFIPKETHFCIEGKNLAVIDACDGETCGHSEVTVADANHVSRCFVRVKQADHFFDTQKFRYYVLAKWRRNGAWGYNVHKRTTS